MKELISIIVPIYNVEKYLPRCIESIQAQTYKNLEILLIDDGSPDSCPEICDDYAKKDKRIKVIHKANGGLSDARNAGIDAATGEYLGFVDSDDYIHPEMYERLWKQVVQERADIALCNMERVYGAVAKRFQAGEDLVKTYSGTQAIKNILDKNLHVISVVAWGKLYKKNLFEGVRFPKGKIHEDEFTTYKLYYKSGRVVELSGQYYFYFQRDDSIMGVKNKKISYDGLEAYERMAEFFKEEKNTELLYMIKYKYLYMLKETVKNIIMNEDIREYALVDEINQKYKKEYQNSISGIKGVKRKVRLGLYYWFKINI